jgi:tRNA-Thr(GGU) m(6)t(6)A37 methyltransferase TsaA
MPDREEPVFRIRPVGTVRGGLSQPPLAFSDGDLQIREVESRGSVSPGQVSDLVLHEEYTDCLDGIEDFSHVVVLYWPHKVGEQGRHIEKVHPAGQKDLPLVGIFSTRSPARPNPICLSTVELLEREGNVLRVKGLDAVDGSPIIDIKPHHPFFDAPEGVRLAEWMITLMRRFRGRD